MPRPYWLLSLVPVVGGPLAFWLQNRSLIDRSVDAASRGYRAGGVGGGLVGMAEGLGHTEGADNALGEAIEQVAQHPATDPRLGQIRRDIGDGPPTLK